MPQPRIYCCSNGCLNSTVKRPELSFFKLPSENVRRNMWLALISREDLADKKAKSYVVCEEHFHAHEILRAEHRKNLKKNALPSLNLPGDAHNKQVVAFEVLLKVERSTQTTESDYNSLQKTVTNNSLKRKLKRKEQNLIKRTKLEDVENQSRKQQKRVFYKLCDKFLSTEFAELVKTQTRLDPKAKKQHLSITTEINEKVIGILKSKVEHMTNDEKICSLIVDAMELRPHLVYNNKQDRFIGFHEIAGVQTGDPATMAVVLVLRGFVVNWQQPVGFALLSEYRDYDGTTKWINKVIEKICEIGLDVKAIISNMETDMYHLAKERSISPEKPFFTSLKVKLFYIFDTSNLIKMVRDNFLEYEFNFQGCVASMDPIKQFYAQDKEKSCSLAPKLTQSHIDPNSEEKKVVRLATQLLSNSVAAAILTYIDFYVIDESGKDTVKFLKLINDLFDLLNTTNIKGNNICKKAFNGDPAQVKLFNEAINLFRTLKLVDPKTGRDMTSSAKFIEGFQITIGSIMLLLEDLRKKKITHLRTKWLSSDVTTKLFNQIKTTSAAIDDPTSAQFITAFRQLFLRDLMKPPAGKDCSMMIANLLTIKSSPDDLDDDADEHNDTTTFTIDESDGTIKVKSSDYNQIEIPEKNAVVYLSSYLLKRCFEKHKDCPILNSYVAIAPEQRIHNFGCDVRYQRYRKFSKESNVSLLVVPYDDFITFVEMMDEEFRSSFKKKHIEREVASFVYKELSELTFSLPCPCFPIVYLKKLFIRMRIFHIVQFNNKKWRASFLRRKYFTVPNL